MKQLLHDLKEWCLEHWGVILLVLFALRVAWMVWHEPPHERPAQPPVKHAWWEYHL